MTDRQEYQRRHEIFAAVVEREPGERFAELARLCGDDTALREQVEALLKFHEQEGGLLSRPLVASAGPSEVGTAATMIQPGPTERVGDRIGHYRLLQEIGEGGFGVVYMAEQKEPVRRKVALKIIKLGMDTKQVIARFEVERQALAMMDHPNIAKVLDAGATETGRPYFVMELVKGDPVTEYCDRQNLGTRERLEIFQQICHAVQHAHQKGVIHRDLKPSNVLVTVADGKPIPKVIDFGIAKATNRELTDKTLFTEFRQLIGTPEYMSPEQAEMTGVDIDTRSDLYVLGVLLYELLTGTTPFDPVKLRSAAYGEIQRIIREEEPPKPSTRLQSLLTTGQALQDDERSSIQFIARHRRAEPASLSRLMRGDLDWIVMKCLEKDRTRRYETANGLASDIQRYLDDEPVSAGPPSAAYRLQKFVRRNRVGVAMGGLVAATLLLGVIGTSWGMLSAQREAESARLAESAEAAARAEAVRERDRALDAETRATQELTRAEEVKRIITEMFSSVDPTAPRGEDTRLLKRIMAETAQRISEGGIKDDLVAAELHHLIGHVYCRLRELDSAAEHLPVAFAIRRRLLGSQHRHTILSHYWLALLHLHQGSRAEAESLVLELEGVSARMASDLGEEHPDTQYVNRFLANLYRQTGDLQSAESVYRRMAQASHQVSGGERPRTLIWMHELAELYRQQGRPDDAARLVGELIEVRARTDGPEAPMTLGALSQLARVREEQGQLDEAETLYLRILEVRRRRLGSEHYKTLETLSSLGWLYVRTEQFEDAAASFEECVPLQQLALGIDNPWTRSSMESLATSYEKLGRYEDVLSVRRELVEYQLGAGRSYADAEWLNSTAWNLLTHHVTELRDPQLALVVARAACSRADPAPAHMLDTLALALFETGDVSGAVETARRTLDLLPADAPDRQAYIDQLQRFEEALDQDPAPRSREP